MTITDMIVNLSEGNPGAATVLARVFAEAEEHAPFAEMPLIIIFALDGQNIRGSNIWILFKDVCHESMENFYLLFQSLGASQTEIETVKEWIEKSKSDVDFDQMREDYEAFAKELEEGA